ncbi:MAG TPA: hypothetical protein ENF63_01405 [Candidatus Bathyarchaeota archaeon]|nr:hypothetical protein [Candidatus Bathyarchaeota archaeon]
MMFTKEGELIGKIVENPKYKEKLEEKILYLIEKYKGLFPNLPRKNRGDPYENHSRSIFN